MTKWDEFFTYDETSPTCLRWAVDRRGGKDGRILKVSAGDVAGSLTGAGEHYEVTVEQIPTYCHRVVWEMFNGELPADKTVDHEDGNGLNNKHRNLRAVPHCVNMRNRRQNSNNTSGITGIGKYGSRGEEFWRASCTQLDGKTKSKRFSCFVYGHHLAKELAIRAREEMIEELNAQGAGYSLRHGKELQ